MHSGKQPQLIKGTIDNSRIGLTGAGRTYRPLQAGLPTDTAARQRLKGEAMDDLIPVTDRAIAGATVQTVNARDLHTFLENGDRFATWIKDRLEQYSFSEGQDFTTYSENSEKGRPRTEYAVTIDMAKELCMVERNTQGLRNGWRTHPALF